MDRGRVEEVLAALTAEDGELVYRAIRLAAPGGLGAVAEEEDVAESTCVSGAWIIRQRLSKLTSRWSQ